MEELAQSFRIPIKRHSCWRNASYIAIWLCYSITLVLWPYDLATWLKVTSSLALAFSLWALVIQQSKSMPDIMFLSESGEIGFDSQVSRQAVLTRASFISLSCVKLHFKRQLNQQGQWLVLHNDQITVGDSRRVRRIITRIRQQSQDNAKN